ncbi:MAG: hypothetical protein P8012_17910 [Desulfobacterales bacterium]
MEFDNKILSAFKKARGITGQDITVRSYGDPSDYDPAAGKYTRAEQTASCFAVVTRKRSSAKDDGSTKKTEYRVGIPEAELPSAMKSSLMGRQSPYLRSCIMPGLRF